MISSYTDNPYSIIHTGNITTIYTYVKNLPKSHEFEAVEGKNGYTQRFYSPSEPCECVSASALFAYFPKLGEQQSSEHFVRITKVLTCITHKRLGGALWPRLLQH